MPKTALEWILALALGLVIIGLGIFTLSWSPAVERRSPGTLSWSNVKRLAGGLSMYISQNDDKMPASSEWAIALVPYLNGPDAFHDPLLPGNDYSSWKKVTKESDLKSFIANGPWGFAFDSRLGSVQANKVSHPERRIALYSSTNPAWNATDPFTSYRENHVNHRANIGFADGHAKQVPSASLRVGLEYVH